MKTIFYFFTVMILVGCASVNTGADPKKYKPKKTFILAQIDSISSNDNEVFFTPIQSYTTQLFKAIELDGSEVKGKSKFYVNLVSNNFGEGVVETTSAQLKKLKRNRLYLLEVNIIKSRHDKLVIKDVLKSNNVKLSTMFKLE
ncbi:MAG: hypothetical protein JEZ03_18645 [Bacteroidales bacterium]|nr:hypothetical protein [Bacteroidales bacterium]